MAVTPYRCIELQGDYLKKYFWENCTFHIEVRNLSTLPSYTYSSVYEATGNILHYMDYKSQKWD